MNFNCAIEKLIVVWIIMGCNILFAQEAISKEDSIKVQQIIGQEQSTKISHQFFQYMVFKEKNGYEIQKLDSTKVQHLKILNEVRLKNELGEFKSLSIDQFLELFQNQSFNKMMIFGLERKKSLPTTWRLGTTSYVLIVNSEDYLSKKFNALQK